MLVLFICFFGISSIRRYYKKETIFLRNTQPSPDIPAPAVTFCPTNKKTDRGWKDDNFSEISTHCRQYKEDTSECILQETYTLTDFLKKVSKGLITNDSLTDPSLWSQDWSGTYYGVCHTYYRSEYMGLDFLNDMLVLQLDKNFNYKIFIHDKNYFEIMNNPMSIPMVRMNLITDTETNSYYKMTMIQHRELNVPGDPCEDDPGYSFRSCVKESFSRKVGCRTGWDSWSDQSRNVCMNLESYRYVWFTLNTMLDIFNSYIILSCTAQYTLGTARYKLYTQHLNYLINITQNKLHTTALSGITCLPRPEKACIQLVTGPLPCRNCGKAFSSPLFELSNRFLP